MSKTPKVRNVTALGSNTSWDGNELDTLRAELERVTAERDALAHWRQKYHELAAENTRLEAERDQYIERCEDLQTVQLCMVEELAKVEGEARVARAAAARYKHRAAAVYRYWCSYWGSRADWGMLRDVLGTLKEATR